MARCEHARLQVVVEGEYKDGEDVVVYQFERNWIKMIVDIRFQRGNYWIGTLEDGAFTPCYIGRATDQPLQTRILQHTNRTDNHYYDERYYFHFDVAVDDADAIRQECVDFHSFGEDDVLDNEIHPALPDGDACPCIGCDHVGGE